ncbi:MAG: hypothetical protein AAF442_02855 [Pseudomonadota bacterium]
MMNPTPPHESPLDSAVNPRGAMRASVMRLQDRAQALTPPQPRQAITAAETLTVARSLARGQRHEAVLHRLRDRLAVDEGAGLPRQAWRLAPLVWSLGLHEEDQTPRLKAILANYQAAMGEDFFAYLLESYLLSYQPGSLLTSQSARLLQTFLPPADNPWAVLQRKSGFLEPLAGHRKVTQALLLTGLSVPETLTQLAHGQERSRFVQALINDLPAVVQDLPWSQVRAEGLRALLAQITDHADVCRLARTLPHSLVRGRGLVWDPCARVVFDFLLYHFGDPRRDAKPWQEIDVALPLGFAWAMRADIDRFYEDGDPHGSFWRTLWGQGHLMGVWCADSAAQTTNTAGADASANLGVARYDGVGAVLLIQVGERVLADIAAQGVLRVWPKTSRHAPRLWQAVYQAKDLEKGHWWQRGRGRTFLLGDAYHRRRLRKILEAELKTEIPLIGEVEGILT